MHAPMCMRSSCMEFRHVFTRPRTRTQTRYDIQVEERLYGRARVTAGVAWKVLEASRLPEHFRRDSDSVHTREVHAYADGRDRNARARIVLISFLSFSSRTCARLTMQRVRWPGCLSLLCLKLQICSALLCTPSG